LYISVLFKPVFLAYHCHNTKHVSVPQSAVNINAYVQDSGVHRDFVRGGGGGVVKQIQLRTVGRENEDLRAAVP
jgi:hypothetical protein